MKKLLASASAVAVLALAGCGDSSGVESAAAPTSDVPASAQASVTGLVAYLNRLIDETNETSEPVLLGDAVLPVDDTTETSL